MKKYLILVLLISASFNTTFSQETNNSETKNVFEFNKSEKFNFDLKEIEKKLNDPSLFKYDENSKELLRLQSNNNLLVSGKTEPESELHAAINPLDSNNIVISPIKQSTNNPLEVVTCPIYYTKDFGKTWKASNFITKPSRPNIGLAGGGDPVFAFDANGKLYLSWINLFYTFKTGSTTTMDSIFAGLYWAESTDGGANWTFKDEYIGKAIGSGKIVNSQMSLNFMIDKQWMAVDLSNSQYKNTLYVSGLTINYTPTQSLSISIYRKLPTSNVFIREGTKINTSSFTEIQFGSLVVDNMGYIHVTFYGKASGVSALYHSVSKDGALTFSTPNIISRFAGIMESVKDPVVGISTSRLYPSPYLAVDNSNSINTGNLYLTWSSYGLDTKLGYGLEVYVATSTDGGTSWGIPVVVNNNPKTKTHNFYPSISVNPDGVVLVSWYDRRYDAVNIQTDIFLGLSFDGGKTFTNKLITGAPSDFSKIGKLNSNFGIGEYNAVLSTKYSAIPVWADGRKNTGDIDIYTAFVKIDDKEEGKTDVSYIVPVNTEFQLSNVTPNPATTNVNISLLNHFPGKFILEIVDFSGKKVLEPFNLNMVDATTFNFSYEINALANGTYFLKVSNENTYTLRKFVVSR